METEASAGQRARRNKWTVFFSAVESLIGAGIKIGAASAASAFRPRPGRGRSGTGGRPGRRQNGFLEGLTHLTDDRLSKAALEAAVKTGRSLLNRPSIRTSLEAAVLKLLGGLGEHAQSIEAVRERANTIAVILQKRGIVPNRIAVDGLPGSGKSTLARALANRLGFKWKSLDHENVDLPQDFSPGRTVYEHHRLLRTQDVDAFDAIVYADEPVTVSKRRVLQRARSEARHSLIIDVLDYEKLTTIGTCAFDVCEGQPISIAGTRLLLKARPTQGFRAMENIVSRLRTAGYDGKDMRKEEMLFLLLYGEPHSGLKAYFAPGAYNRELLAGLAAGLRRYLAA